MSRAHDFKYDPFSGLQWTSSVPIQADTYRTLYPKRVWWTNPWTGIGRSVADVNDNPYMQNVPAPPMDESCAQEGLHQAHPQPAQHDPVEHPKHYTSHPSGVECIQVTEHMGFNLGNALKYIWRADLKANAVEDLKKAVWYIQRELEKRGRGS